jgi:hypothetical protein
MLELIVPKTKKEKRELLRFYKSQYLNNPLRRDSLSGLLEGVLFETSVMNQSMQTLPLMIKKDKTIVMMCVIAKAWRLPTYLQISFFESKDEHMDAFKMLFDKAMEISRLWGTEKICASLNIHVNYGLGFLADAYHRPQSFGMAHNDPYIHGYFEAFGFQAIPMVTFYKDMKKEFQIIGERLRERLNKRYTVRHADFKNIKKEAKIYTEINNDAFSNHPFYYKRVEAEDLELFKNFKWLLKPENLLFVEKAGQPVGFMLWYPDFHQIMKPKESIGLRTVIRAALWKEKLTRFKIVEMGIIQEEQKKGAILALFDHCFRITKDKYAFFESGWVLKENTMSGSLGYKWSDGIDKNYIAYVKEL